MATQRKSPRKMSASELLRRKLFAIHYVRNGGNASAAAREVGVSETSAGEMGSRWLKEVETQAFVDAERKRVETKTGITTERVVLELHRILTADIAESIDENGAFKPLKDWPEDLRRALSGIDNEELWGTDDEGNREPIGTIRKARFWSKTDAADRLLKVLGGYAPQKHEVTVIGVADKLRKARERAAQGASLLLAEGTESVQ